MKLDWLTIARELQSIAQAGITFGESKYDLERYERLLQISKEIVLENSNISSEKLDSLYATEEGYLTPKVDVRGVVIRDGKILFVKETIDDRWSLPGGWADVGYSPSEVVEKEVLEESGLQVKASRLLGVLDKAKHDHPPDIFYVYKLFFHCEETGGLLKAGMETSEVAFFDIDKLPELSTPRNTIKQTLQMYHLVKNGKAPSIFD
jgi:ADP-ribose pyrophosphatase YjhB (NUDIX family)